MQKTWASGPGGMHHMDNIFDVRSMGNMVVDEKRAEKISAWYLSRYGHTSEGIWRGSNALLDKNAVKLVDYGMIGVSEMEKRVPGYYNYDPQVAAQRLIEDPKADLTKALKPSAGKKALGLLPFVGGAAGAWMAKEYAGRGEKFQASLAGIGIFDPTGAADLINMGIDMTKPPPPGTPEHLVYQYQQAWEGANMDLLGGLDTTATAIMPPGYSKPMTLERANDLMGLRPPPPPPKLSLIHISEPTRPY